MYNFLRTLILPIVLGFSVVCSATEPLHDTLIVDGHSGPFFPEECCSVGLPKTERFRAAMQKEFGNCSAIGGIVGRFRLADGKIWLVGLHRCSGSMPLQDIYPELDNPAFATWVSGAFTAKMDYMCRAQHDDQNKYRTTLKLKIENGVVTDMQREEHDEAVCRAS